MQDPRGAAAVSSRWMRSLLCLALAVALAPLASDAIAAPGRVQLLSSGPTSVRFVVEVPEPVLTALPGDGGLQTLALDEYVVSGAPGAPGLVMRSVQVAVPASGEIRVHGAALNDRVLERVSLAPSPEYVRAETEIEPRYARSAEAYAAPAPRVAARLLGVTWMRNQRIATVGIYPADFDPRSGTLQVAERVEVEIELGGGDERVGTLAEPDDPFESIYRSTIVNYEQGKRWRRTRAGARIGGGQALAAPPAMGIDALPQDSVFAGRKWAKIGIAGSGFYKVNYGQVRNLAAFAGLIEVPVRNLRLFAMAGYPALPENAYCDSCGLREVAIQFVNDDTLFDDNSDEIYFFALGPNDWQDVFDPARNDSDFVNHPFETRNYYFLTADDPGNPLPGAAQRIGVTSAAPNVDGSEIVPTTFEMRVHREKDLVALPNLSPKNAGQTEMFWEKFFWATQQIDRDFPADTMSLPGVDMSQPALLRIRMWGASAEFSFPPGPSHLLDVTYNGVGLPRAGYNGSTIGFTYVQTVVPQAFNTLTIRIPRPAGALSNRDDRQALAWYQVRYARRFEPVGDELAFDSPVSGGNYLYSIGPFANANAPRLFDVTDPFAPSEIVSTVYRDSADGRWLHFETFESARRRYRIIQGSSIVAVANAEVRDASLLSQTPLRGSTLSADYLVIYYDGFKEAADVLRDWRATHLPVDGGSGAYTALSIPVSALYDQFSGGRQDPGAIRSFLRYAFYNWARPPRFVTLLGDASWDYKNILRRAPAGQPASPVPSYENGFTIGTAYASDDWMLNVNDPARQIPEYIGGRIPVTSAPQALAYVQNKVIAYEQSSPFGAYRNQLMLVADDDKQGEAVDALHWAHMSQTSQVDTLVIPPHIDRELVYLHKYPDGPGATKPVAKNELKQNVNDGLLLFNFIGHGSPFKIADETVLLDSDSETFTNTNKLAIFVAASCDVGRFSDPQVQSLGERIVLAPSGGTVAVVSATELALSSFNADLGRQFFAAMFQRGPVSGAYFKGIGEALFTAKIVTGTEDFRIENNAKYQVMGDAGTPFNLPQRWVDVNIYPCDTCSTPLTELTSGQVAFVRGRVLDRPGGSLVPISGVADLLIEDSAPYETTPRCTYAPVATCDPFIALSSYYYRAGAMYRGDARITNGVFGGSFVVPMEAVRGPRGRVRAYVQGQEGASPVTHDGVGSLRNQISPGQTALSDSAGPAITLSFEGGATSVKSDATLRVDLFDPSGILITGHSPQNGIIVTLDENSTARVDITPSFRYLAGSYQSGSASFQLPGIAPGPHTISVSAADNLAAGLTAGIHRASASIEFQVADVPPLTITYAYLFPNPTHSGGSGSGGQFVIDAKGDSLNALLRIYTVSGKLVRTLTRFGGIGQVQIPWDGLDAEGQKLANGVYFFRVQVNVRDEAGKSSPIQKATAEGRLVVVNH